MILNSTIYKLVIGFILLCLNNVRVVQRSEDLFDEVKCLNQRSIEELIEFQENITRTKTANTYENSPKG